MLLRYWMMVVFILPAPAGLAQYFQYSQYNFATQRINPALVVSSAYASVGMLYRNQGTAGSTNLQSSMISAAYPILSGKTGRRSSGIGLSLMDDRAGGIFATQEASFSYAMNVFLNRYQSLALGVKTLYQQRKLNLDGLFTGSQYIPDRGFDDSMYNGEQIQFLKTDFLTFSAGLYWQETDRRGNRKAYWGISIFDFNNPQDSFFGLDSELSSTCVAHGGITVYQANPLSVTPEILFTRSAGNNVINIGTVTSYQLQTLRDQPSVRMDIITKYVFGRSGVLGLQWHRENFSIGCSYDFPLLKQNVGNLSSFEVGMELRKLVDRRPKRRGPSTKKPPSTRKSVTAKPAEKKETKVNVIKSGKPGADSALVQSKPQPSLKTTIQAKQDSAIASAEAGKIQHQPLTLEKATLHFNFEFNSSELDEESMKYLDELSAVLLENNHLKIKLTGHTDNIGTAKFNQRLSVFRANMIQEYLVAKGVLRERIETRGKGLSEPLNENKTEEERAKNRRVELEILYDY